MWLSLHVLELKPTAASIEWQGSSLVASIEQAWVNTFLASWSKAQLDSL
jgi:hypothetical protein